MAKKKGDAREYVWLQCTETGDLNYRTQVNVKGGLPEGLKEGLTKYCPRLRKPTVHKLKRKYSPRISSKVEMSRAPVNPHGSLDRLGQ